ncbi:MAG: Wzy polymerase domain-containing protein, partial [Rhodoferax sp.]|nr:Wzy polymerase domain-containing protein [Rhodoferax sp.]
MIVGIRLSRYALRAKADAKNLPLWLPMWSVVLALGWLLPNHYVPWVAFHFDLWVACCLALAATALVVSSRRSIRIHPLALLCLFLLPIPFFQFWFSLLPFIGQAWLGGAFIFGFFLSLLVGAYWEDTTSGQAIDSLFLAIGIAGVASVGLQLYQWLGSSIDTFDLWIMDSGNGRPFANFIQPNQLATFLLWSLLATAWGVAHSQIRQKIAIFQSLFLLFGIALTGSRTAFVAVVGLLCATFLWRNLWKSKATVPTVLGLAVFYFVCVFLLPSIAKLFELAIPMGLIERPGGGVRITVYQLFLDAAWQQPFWGYGWAQSALAQMAVAENHPPLASMFLQAHNLFLDLVIWCGIPLGLAISGTLMWWFVDMAKKIAKPRDAILLMFVAVVGWHAMLELPLHYAYMLLPTGLVMGVLNSRLATPVRFQLNRWCLGCLLLAGITLLTFIARDYVQIEENFRVLRFERARIGATPAQKPDAVVLLNQMDEFVKLGRTPAKQGMTAEELAWMQKAAYAYPGLS